MTKIKSLLVLLPALVVAVVPVVSSAQAGSIQELIVTFSTILAIIVPFLIALAVVFFLWGVLQFITAGGDEEKRATGRDTMIYGIIAIFVMVSIWGLVNILEGTFNLGGQASPPVPELPV